MARPRVYLDLPTPTARPSLRGVAQYGQREAMGQMGHGRSGYMDTPMGHMGHPWDPWDIGRTGNTVGHMGRAPATCYVLTQIKQLLFFK